MSRISKWTIAIRNLIRALEKRGMGSLSFAWTRCHRRRRERDRFSLNRIGVKQCMVASFRIERQVVDADRHPIERKQFPFVADGGGVGSKADEQAVLPTQGANGMTRKHDHRLEYKRRLTWCRSPSPIPAHRLWIGSGKIAAETLEFDDDDGGAGEGIDQAIPRIEGRDRPHSPVRRG